MRVYLDNCCFNRPFDDQTRIRVKLEAEAVLHIQGQILAGEIELAWSYVIDYENQFNPFPERRNSIQSWKHYAVLKVSETNDILKLAETIGAKGAETFDALHVASAIEAACSHFLTTDDLLLRKLSEFDKIKIVNPIQYLSILERQNENR